MSTKGAPYCPSCGHQRCGNCTVQRGVDGRIMIGSIKAPAWPSNVPRPPTENASNSSAEQLYLESQRGAEATGSSIASGSQPAESSIMGTQPDIPEPEQTEPPSASTSSGAKFSVVNTVEERSNLNAAQGEAGCEDSNDNMASNSAQHVDAAIEALDTLLATRMPEGTTEEISFQNICIPPGPVPCIDGRPGSKTSEIRKASGARMSIDKPAFGDTGGYLLTASGSDAANEAALKLISEELKAEDTEHTFASPTKDPLSVSEIMIPGSRMASTDSEGREETDVSGKSTMWKPELESQSGAQTSTANLLPAAANSMALATPPKRKPPIKFKDALGRNFNFPFELCQTWKGTNDLICQAFAHIETLNAMVNDGRFDLVGPNGEGILPQTWDYLVEPGWRVAMQMWPIKKLEKKVHIDTTNTRPVPTAAPVPKRAAPPRISSRPSGSSFGRSKSLLEPKDKLFFTKKGVEEEPLLDDTNKEDLPKAAEKDDDDNSSVSSSSTLEFVTVNDSDLATDDEASPFTSQPPQQRHIEGPVPLHLRISPILIEDKGGPSGIDISAKSGIRHRPAASGGSGGRAPRQTPGEDRDIEQEQPHSPACQLSRGLTATSKSGRGRGDPDDSSPPPGPVSARLCPKRSHPCLGLATLLCLILGIISFAILGIAFKDAYILEHYTLEHAPRSSESCSNSSPSLSDPSFYFALQESGWLTVRVVSALIPACKHAYKYQKWFGMCYVWIPAAISLGLGMASPLTYVRSPAVSNGLAGMAGAMQAMVIYYATYEVFIEERIEDMAAIELRRRRRARRND